MRWRRAFLLLLAAFQSHFADWPLRRQEFHLVRCIELHPVSLTEQQLKNAPQPQGRQQLKPSLQQLPPLQDTTEEQQQGKQQQPEQQQQTDKWRAKEEEEDAGDPTRAPAGRAASSPQPLAFSSSVSHPPIESSSSSSSSATFSSPLSLSPSNSSSPPHSPPLSVSPKLSAARPLASTQTSVPPSGPPPLRPPRPPRPPPPRFTRPPTRAAGAAPSSAAPPPSTDSSLSTTTADVSPLCRMRLGKASASPVVRKFSADPTPAHPRRAPSSETAWWIPFAASFSPGGGAAGAAGPVRAHPPLSRQHAGLVARVQSVTDERQQPRGRERRAEEEEEHLGQSALQQQQVDSEKHAGFARRGGGRDGVGPDAPVTQLHDFTRRGKQQTQEPAATRAAADAGETETGAEDAEGEAQASSSLARLTNQYGKAGQKRASLPAMLVDTLRTVDFLEFAGPTRSGAGEGKREAAVERGGRAKAAGRGREGGDALGPAAAAEEAEEKRRELRAKRGRSGSAGDILQRGAAAQRVATGRRASAVAIRPGGGTRVAAGQKRRPSVDWELHALAREAATRLFGPQSVEASTEEERKATTAGRIATSLRRWRDAANSRAIRHASNSQGARGKKDERRNKLLPSRSREERSCDEASSGAWCTTAVAETQEEKSATDAGPDAAGPDAAGPDAARPDGAGPAGGEASESLRERAGPEGASAGGEEERRRRHTARQGAVTATAAAGAAGTGRAADPRRHAGGVEEGRNEQAVADSDGGGGGAAAAAGDGDGDQRKVGAAAEEDRDEAVAPAAAGRQDPSAARPTSGDTAGAAAGGLAGWGTGRGREKTAGVVDVEAAAGTTATRSGEDSRATLRSLPVEGPWEKLEDVELATLPTEEAADTPGETAGLSPPRAAAVTVGAAQRRRFSWLQEGDEALPEEEEEDDLSVEAAGGADTPKDEEVEGGEKRRDSTGEKTAEVTLRERRGENSRLRQARRRSTEVLRFRQPSFLRKAVRGSPSIFASMRSSGSFDDEAGGPGAGKDPAAERDGEGETAAETPQGYAHRYAQGDSVVLTERLREKLANVDTTKAMQTVANGSHLMKWCRNGFAKPHKRFFRIDAETLVLLWKSPNKPVSQTSISLNDVQRIVPGDDSDFFRNKPEQPFGIEIFSPTHKLRIALSGATEWEYWMKGLLTCHFLALTRHSHAFHFHRALGMWHSAQKTATPDGDLVDFSEAFRVLADAELVTDEVQLREVFDKHDVAKRGAIGAREFQELARELLQPHVIDLYFDAYREKGTDYMTEAGFRSFLEKVQHVWDDALEHELQEFKSLYIGARDGQSLQISVMVLGSYLCSTVNSIMDPRKAVVYQDMTRPFSEYWINSSHNTYLIGDQIASKSMVGQYIDVLLEGTRCVELDCWDGPGDEPVIFHGVGGYAVTTGIPFRDVIKACANYGFQRSTLPIVLSLEMHCHRKQRRRIAEILQEILKDKLYQPSSLTSTPSPEELRGMFIVKGKIIDDAGDYVEEGDEEDINLWTLELMQREEAEEASWEDGQPGSGQLPASPQQQAPAEDRKSSSSSPEPQIVPAALPAGGSADGWYDSAAAADRAFGGAGERGGGAAALVQASVHKAGPPSGEESESGGSTSSSCSSSPASRRPGSRVASSGSRSCSRGRERTATGGTASRKAAAQGSDTGGEKEEAAEQAHPTFREAVQSPDRLAAWVAAAVRRSEGGKLIRHSFRDFLRLTGMRGGSANITEDGSSADRSPSLQHECGTRPPFAGGGGEQEEAPLQALRSGDLPGGDRNRANGVSGGREEKASAAVAALQQDSQEQEGMGTEQQMPGNRPQGPLPRHTHCSLRSLPQSPSWASGAAEEAEVERVKKAEENEAEFPLSPPWGGDGDRGDDNDGVFVLPGESRTRLRSWSLQGAAADELACCGPDAGRSACEPVAHRSECLCGSERPAAACGADKGAETGEAGTDAAGGGRGGRGTEGRQQQCGEEACEAAAATAEGRRDIPAPEDRPFRRVATEGTLRASRPSRVVSRGHARSKSSSGVSRGSSGGATSGSSGGSSSSSLNSSTTAVKGAAAAGEAQGRSAAQEWKKNWTASETGRNNSRHSGSSTLRTGGQPRSGTERRRHYTPPEDSNKDDTLYNSVIKMQGKKLHSFDEPRGPMDVCSMPEAHLEHAEGGDPVGLARFCQKHLVRVYPSGTRLGSSNYDPMQPWLQGVQMAALNMQSVGSATILNAGRFLENGGRAGGYVLKPEILRDPEHPFNPSDPSSWRDTPLSLTVRVYSGHHLPKPRRISLRNKLPSIKKPAEAKESLNPVVTVAVAGVEPDTQAQRTRITYNNGAHPRWESAQSTFKFHVMVPSVALLTFQVHSSEGNKAELCGAFSLPVTSVRQGIRWVPLRDSRLLPTPESGLLVHITMDRSR